MFSYVTEFFNYIIGKKINDDNEIDDASLDAALAQMELEDALKHNECYAESEYEIPETKPKNCFQKSGIISYIDIKNNYVLIDGTHFLDTSSCSHKLNLNDKILYLGYYKEDNQMVIVKVLQNEGTCWGDDNTEQEINFDKTNHTLIGLVHHREGRFVHMAQGDIKFNLDDVESTFVPIEGDLLEMSCKVISNKDSENEEIPIAISSTEVLDVSAIRPLGLRIQTGIVKEWNGEHGQCNDKIYFERSCLPTFIRIRVGLNVIMKTIEISRDNYSYRAIELQQISENSTNDTVDDVVDNVNETSQIEMDQQLEITHKLTFNNVEMDDSSQQIFIKVTNKSDQTHLLTKWIVLSNKRNSQINISPTIHRPLKISPNSSITITVSCTPKFMGKAKEHLIMLFKGFKVKRTIEINVVSKQLAINNNVAYNTKRCDIHSKMKEIRRNENEIVSGRKFLRTANFVAMRFGMFRIPNAIWTTILGDSGQVVQPGDFKSVLARLDDKYPFLNQNLTIYNYADKWHTLLFIEEVQETINMRMYDISKTYLLKCQEYLSLVVNGLAEKRPSLVVGDRAIVTDILDISSPRYEGIIHEIRGNCILMKFSYSFHECYTGSDVSVEFYFNRSSFRRSHHATNLALSNLGPDILFPCRLPLRKSQIQSEKLEAIQWFNKSLNDGQKAAVANILLGECRPKPYCIYGPPGTGKTVTVVETILQILTNIPYSRILVAAPSNSAANLITERLLDYKNKNPYSMVRIVAHHLIKGDKIPSKVKPYCITLDIAKEGTAMSKQEIQFGVNVNCQSSFVGRHRITIGTCNVLGTLSNLGFAKDHFSHVIVDEAGQATEPEILIPLTLINKDNGQIILAGDPMQLGPIVISQHSKEYGMEESYLSRLLETVPYKKDFTAYQGGYNKKLVTKLNENYRSLKEILTLPSEMFYDGSLVEKIDRNQPWIERLINVVSDIFETGDVKAGGIYVHGIRGCNTRSEDSPSWYNPQEAGMVALTVSKIFKENVSPDMIGIITPYVAQIKYLRSLFEGIGLPLPKIGTVEEFQGQEKPLVIISTVRSTESLLEEDFKHALGFVKNYKRLNVAITRAQVVAILFCDPHVLCTDPLWFKVVDQAVKEDKYVGCDLPNICNK